MALRRAELGALELLSEETVVGPFLHGARKFDDCRIEVFGLFRVPCSLARAGGAAGERQAEQQDQEQGRAGFAGGAPSAACRIVRSHR